MDLLKQADEAEAAFIKAARLAKSEEDDKRAKALCHEYLNVLKLIRLKGFRNA